MSSQAQPILTEHQYIELELAELRAEHERELENARIRAENPIFDVCFKILTKKSRKTKAKGTARSRPAQQEAFPDDPYFYPDRAANSLDGGVLKLRRHPRQKPRLRTLAEILSRRSEPQQPANLDAPRVSEHLSAYIRKIEAIGALSGFSPLHHLDLLHGHQTREKQWLAICKKVGADDHSASKRPWNQWMYQFDHDLLRDQLSSMEGSLDTYISANHFYKPKRYTEHVSGITSIFFDIDKVEQNMGITKEVATAMILKMCDDKGIPHPTLVMDSGNGLHVYFVLDEVQKGSKGEKWKRIWTKIANLIDDTFKGCCERAVDRSVKDLARVLRLAGTVNSKNGQTVKPLYTNGDYLAPTRVSFQALGDAVLELTDAEWKAQFEAKRQEKLARLVVEGKQVPASSEGKVVQLKDHKGSQTADMSNAGKKHFNCKSFARTVIEDLNKLSDAGYVTEGKFDHWLLLYAVQLSYLARSVEELRTQIYEVAKIHGWNLSRAMAVMGTVIARAEAAYRGEKEVYNGKVKDPRYRYSQARMVELLGLKRETILGLDLRALTTPEVKKERNRIRKAAYRKQKKIAQSKEEVAAERDERSERILEQVRSGASVTAIAKANNVSRQTVYNVVNRGHETGTKLPDILRETKLAA